MTEPITFVILIGYYLLLLLGKSCFVETGIFLSELDIH
jgi:hypothetical protein